MEPSWQPDPTGRHHYRWWDGAQWTDQVSDSGVVSTDPPVMSPAPVPEPPAAPAPSFPGAMAPGPTPGGFTPSVPTPAGPTVEGGFTPPTGAPSDPAAGGFTPPVSTPIETFTGASSTPKRRTWLYVALGIAGAVIVAGVGVAALAGGGGSTSGTGVRSIELDSDDAYETHTLDLDVGDVVRVRLEPSRRLDSRAIVLVDRDVAEAAAEVVAERFSDGTDVDEVYDENFSDVDDVITGGDAEGRFEDAAVYWVIDTAERGDFDADAFVALAEGTYTLVITSFDNDSNGDVRMIVEEDDRGFDPEDDDLDEAFDNRFGTERAFYEDDDEYTPRD